MYELVVEAIAVGIVIVIVSFLLDKVDNRLKKNEYLFLFVVGSFTHLVFEAMGFNVWYCKNGNACKKLTI